MKSFTIPIPCKNYIKKYYSAAYGDVIPLEHQSDWGNTILTKMAYPPLVRMNRKNLNLVSGEYKEEIKFSLPIDLLYRIEDKLSDQQTYSINRFLEESLKEDLYLVIKIGSFFGVQIVTIIETFGERFNIDLGEELTLSALKKDYYRRIRKPNTRNFFLAQMSSHFAMSLRA
jgi:hypothetical protein